VLDTDTKRHIDIARDILVGKVPEAPALVNAWDRVHPAAPPAPTFGVHDRRHIAEPACYDIFFVGENIADRVVDVSVDGGTGASDHQPVLLTLR
jgi:endonuclease/exonuclease/phosphatase family metal-dependent hydrolase